MKNKCKFLCIVIFAIAFLLYRSDSVSAMENIQSGISDAETDANAELGQSAETVVKPEAEQNGGTADQPEAEQNIETADQPEAEQNIETADQPEAEQNIETADQPEAEQNIETAVMPEAEQNIETAVMPEAEQNIETAVMPEAEQGVKFAAGPGAEQNIEPAAGSKPEQSMETATVPEPDSVSTGAALTEWLESHKDTGGIVKLTDNVVWDTDYDFCPNGTDKLPVFVDTDKYTITVTGTIELISNDRLTFSGQPDGKSLFYVAEKGQLSLDGVAVESRQYALWQEEGAGLVVGDCNIEGDIHYADIPFVIYWDSICAVVEKGQTVNDVLPAQVGCSVNRQGKLSHNESMPLSWNLEGTENQQEERQRFQADGSFLDAASAEPVLCTVAYNDYPLTMTDVKASVSGSSYIFCGGYTKPEEYLPIAIVSEYSFDGKNWFVCEEKIVTDMNDSFVIVCQSEQHEAYSGVYIRLQWIDDGISYFSNVLCFTADNLEYAKDIGGNRGGGTSITNPPDEPRKSTEDTSPETEGSLQSANENINSENAGSGVPPVTEQAENGNGGIDPDAADDEQPSNAETADSRESEPSHAEPSDSAESGSFCAEPSDSAEGGSFYAGTVNGDKGGTLYAGTVNSDKNEPLYADPSSINEEQSFDLEAKAENDVGNTDGLDKEERTAFRDSGTVGKEQAPHADIRQNKSIVIAAGFMLVAVIAGIAGFYIHSRPGTNR